MFKHVLSGNSTNIRNISFSTGWQGQSPEIRRNVTSALHIPFNTVTEKAMLICISSHEYFFNSSHLQLLKRFTPLAGQALHNLHINKLLTDQTNERKQVEENLDKALQELAEYKKTMPANRHFT